MSQNGTILVVDDEKNLRGVLKVLFENEGYTTLTAGSGREALPLLQDKRVDVLITDLAMPGMDGLELMKAAKQDNPDLYAIMLTAYATTESAIDALRAGAFDYVMKPFNNEELLILVRRALEEKKLRQENIQLRTQLRQGQATRKLVGASPRMAEVISLIKKVAQTPSTVLITGESGTGKEMVAQTIHHSSDRSQAPFLAINCGAMPENLLESELFGHTKGAFTGATQNKVGLFEAAGEGTIFLDEIGDMPLSMQTKLLRVLQERTVRPVGSNQERPFHARLLVATNQDMEAQVKAGEFREDLYYRLNVIRLELPPLRERRTDLPMLSMDLLEEIGHRLGRSFDGFDKDAMTCFQHYSWPGNVRELQNVIERAATLESGSRISASYLPAEIRQPLQEGGEEAAPSPMAMEEPDLGLPMDLENYLEETRRNLLRRALVEAEGNQTQAAKLLGLSFRSFRYYAKKYDLKT